MNTRATVAMLCVALAGCDRVTDAQWAKTVPGLYAASQTGFTEQVDLKIDGSFQHNASFDSRVLVSESGKWSFDVKTGIVTLEPFTSIWDEKSRKLNTNIIHLAVGTLGVMRYGEKAQRISPAVDFDYQLMKNNK